MASSSSAHKLHHHQFLSTYTGSTVAPPPTPSSHPATDSAAAADTLTRLLHRLPPNLSLPTRLSSRATCPPAKISTTPLPNVSLSDSNSVTSSSFELGYFQLSAQHHSISTSLAESAESEALSLFDLPNELKHEYFPRDWPLGFDDDDDDNYTASVCLDRRVSATTTNESAESRPSLTSLRELTRELEELGLQVVEKLACMIGFENPFRENGPVKPCSLMCVSTLEEGDKMARVYPYVVGLQYQIRARKWSMVSGSGSVCVEPEVGSVLVTVGDIAQVWSNGKLNKVRGRSAAVTQEGGNTTSHSISMTMLLTLPLESTVSPLLSTRCGIDGAESGKDQEEATIEDPKNEASTSDIGRGDDYDQGQRAFSCFSFEDYAWRVYHERLFFKDPLDRYRVTF